MKPITKPTEKTIINPYTAGCRLSWILARSLKVATPVFIGSPFKWSTPPGPVGPMIDEMILNTH